MDNSDFYNLDVQDQLEKMGQAAQRALELWSFNSPTLELIKHRENAVYKLTDAAGINYALRVHRLGYHSDAELRSEIEWMQALTASGIQTPEFIAARSGADFETIQVEGVARPFQVDILAWVNGEPLGTVDGGISESTEQLVSVFRKIGQTAARVHNHAQTWSEPTGFTRHAWDVDGLTGEQPFWGRFWEHELLSADQRRLLLAAREKLRSDLINFGQSHDCYGLIHADFLPENFLAGEDGIRLIDFDDAGYGWHLFDFATTLFFQQGETWFNDIQGALIEGYRSERKLSEAHLEMLPVFMLARGTTYLGWMHTRDLPPDVAEMVPAVIELVCSLAEEYLGGQDSNLS